MRIWHISDTHGHHCLLEDPPDDCILIHSGDSTNHLDSKLNYDELIPFLEWYSNLPNRIKIYVPGNHDTSIANKLATRETFTKYGIILLIDELITIDGINIYGTPYTPTYGPWAFMLSRHKIGRIWDNIPDNTNILVTHGPPKGILDYCEKRGFTNSYEMAGCGSMMSRITKLKELKAVLFGHIHDNLDAKNAGVLLRDNIIYANSSVVKDGHFGTIYHEGNIITI